jgi:hypothetical protein
MTTHLTIYTTILPYISTHIFIHIKFDSTLLKNDILGVNQDSIPVLSPIVILLQFFISCNTNSYYIVILLQCTKRVPSCFEETKTSKETTLREFNLLHNFCFESIII